MAIECPSTCTAGTKVTPYLVKPWQSAPQGSEQGNDEGQASRAATDR